MNTETDEIKTRIEKNKEIIVGLKKIVATAKKMKTRDALDYFGSCGFRITYRTNKTMMVNRCLGDISEHENYNRQAQARLDEIEAEAAEDTRIAAMVAIYEDRCKAAGVDHNDPFAALLAGITP
jgi:hypothetical protein